MINILLHFEDGHRDRHYTCIAYIHAISSKRFYNGGYESIMSKFVANSKKVLLTYGCARSDEILFDACIVRVNAMSKYVHSIMNLIVILVNFLYRG